MQPISIDTFLPDGWPTSMKEVPKQCCVYFGCCEDLTIDGEFLMRDKAVVVPMELRPAVLKKVHDPAHMGIAACLRRAQHIFYWPGMAKEMHDCDVM